MNEASYCLLINAWISTLYRNYQSTCWPLEAATRVCWRSNVRGQHWRERGALHAGTLHCTVSCFFIFYHSICSCFPSTFHPTPSLSSLSLSLTHSPSFSLSLYLYVCLAPFPSLSFSPITLFLISLCWRFLLPVLVSTTLMILVWNRLKYYETYLSGNRLLNPSSR